VNVDRKAVEQRISELRADVQSAKERNRVSVVVMAASLASTAEMLSGLLQRLEEDEAP
jgi:hypothetical protein